MPNSVDLETKRAIQVTLDGWRNADGTVLTAMQRSKIDAYLHSDGSGPYGAGSYVEWLRTSLLKNPQYIPDSSGKPLIGATYGFYGGDGPATAKGNGKRSVA